MKSAGSGFRSRVGITVCMLAAAGLLLSCGGKKETDSDSGAKVWKLGMVKYEDLQQTEDAQRGLLAGLRDIGLEEGKHFTLNARSAQGDIASVLSLIDAVKNDGTDILISLQTPTLHSAVKRAIGMPIVFMVVANPFIISTVGQSDSVHLPYITGVYTNTTFDKMIDYLKECMPQVKRIGTLYSTGELNATYYKAQLIAAASKQGIQVETFGVSSRVDVSQSMQALCSKNLDAICQIEDNMTSTTFPTIVQVANQRNLPVFSFVNSQARAGSSVVLAPDYYEAARSAALMISQIMKGTSPEAIPFERVKKFHLIVNLKAAEERGLKIPESMISKADEVIQR